MKTLFFLFFVFACSSWTMGQNNSSSVAGQSIDSSQSFAPPPLVQKFNRMGQVIQTTGRVYSGDDIQHSAAKDINQIANTVPGVQYRPGESLIIRGVQGGAAYFVDGMRVYGALPVMSR